MRGFQPGEARVLPQNYADGGVVSTIKGMLGLGKKKPEPLPADLNKLPPTGAGPAPSQPRPKEDPKKAISQYNGMSALERRMKEADAYADGGLVRGPGTGISDDIEDEVEEGTFIMPADSTAAVGPEVMDRAGKAVPVRLSNGESKLPPEALQAIGAEVMEAIKEVTHTPAAKQARGGDDRMSFADGGVVRPEDRPLTIADRARQPGYAFAAGTYTPKPAATAAAPSAQPVAAAPVTTQPTAQPAQSPKPAQSIAARVAPQSGGASGSWEAKQTAAQSAPQGWATDGDRFMPGVRNVWNESGKAIGDLVDQGRYGAAVGETARAATSYIPALVDDTFGGAYRAVAPAVGDAVAQFFGYGDGNASAPAKPAAAPSSAQKPATPPANNQASTPAPNPATTQPKSGSPKPAADQPAAKPDAREITPGIYRQGNSYGDSPEAAAAGARPSQGPSTQNQSIAAALAQRSGQRPDQPADVMGIYARASEALKGVAEAQRALDDYGPRMSGGVTANDYLTGPASAAKFQQAMYRTALEKQAGQGGRGGAAAMQALNNMEGNQIQREVAQMREQGDTARFNAREAGENTRAGMRNTADARRDSIAAQLAQGKLDLERTAQGYTNRSADRQEKLYADYDAAKTPEERATIAQKIRDLSGKNSQDGRYQLVRGEQVFDEKANALRNTGERLYDTQAGRFVDGGNSVQAQAMPERQDQLKAGQVYETSRGPARWDGKQFTSVGG